MDSLDALNLAAPIADTYNELEAMLLSHIAEQLAANPDTLINATSEWRIKLLAQMGRVNKETAKIIAAKTGKVPAEVEKVVEQAINKVLVENAVSGKSVSAHIENAMKSFDRQAVINKYNQVNTVMQYKAKQAFVNGVNSVADRFERKRQAEIANKQEYLDVLNKNALAVTVGEKSRTEALRETIGQMCDKGIPAFVDASGRQWSPEAYVNMDIRNTAKNSALAAQWRVMDELEQDVILISSHSGARPKCAPYQGKLYSRSGKSGTIKDARGKEYTYEPLSSTSFGEPDGIFGINCGHRPRGVTEGMFISHEEIYSEKENSEEYEKICEQRRQERKIRADKNKSDALKAAGDNEGAKELGRKIIAENKELKAYCEREGLSYREDRTKGYGYVNKQKKISVPRPSEENSQFYKKIVVDKSDQLNATRLVNGNPAEITLNRVADRHNKIYLSEKSKIKPKALHEIDMRMDDVYKLLGCDKRKTLPNICIVSHDEMGNAPAAFNALHNALYLDEGLLTIEKMPEFRSQMACADNRLSTALHECLHWLDADDYRKSHGNITAENYASEYLPYLRNECKKKLDNMKNNGYNINEISRYASNSIAYGNYDEAYTEYRVKKLLKGSE